MAGSRDRSIAVALIGGGAVVLAAVITGIFALVANNGSGNSGGTAHTPTPTTASSSPTQPTTSTTADSSQAPTTTAPSPARTIAERTGPAGSYAFADYNNASGRAAQHIPANATVYISCRVEGQKFGKDPWWYRINSTPYSGRYYAPADNFYNTTDHRKPFLNGILVDKSVPPC